MVRVKLLDRLRFVNDNPACSQRGAKVGDDVEHIALSS